MKVTMEGSKSEIVDFILLLQNRRIARIPYSNDTQCTTVSPEDLLRHTDRTTDPVILTGIDM